MKKLTVKEMSVIKAGQMACVDGLLHPECEMCCGYVPGDNASSCAYYCDKQPV